MKTKHLVFMALFVALSIVFTRYLSLKPAASIRISLTFIAYAISGFMFGPLFTMAVAVLADIVGFMIAPDGTFNLIITVAAGVSGFAFGFMKNHPGDWVRLIVVLIVIAVVAEAGLTTYGLRFIYETSFMSVLGLRIWGILANLAIRLIIMIPLMKAYQRGVFKMEG